MTTFFVCLAIVVLILFASFLCSFVKPPLVERPVPTFVDTDTLAFPGTADKRTHRDIDAYIKAENGHPERMAALHADNLMEKGVPSFIAVMEGAALYGADDQKVRALLNLNPA